MTTVTFRDNQGRLIANQGELPTERGGPGTGGPVVTCGGASVPRSPGSTFLPAPSRQRPSGNGATAFLQFVTQRSA